MKNAPKKILLTGGSRSGKSSYALTFSAGYVRPYFIATGWAGDAEMSERIARHKKERDERWTLIETRLDVAGAIRRACAENADFILVDCLTLWVSNLFLEEERSIEFVVDELAELISSIELPIVLVTNEVGMGIVPENALAREYRDVAGMVNKKIATAVDALYLTVCGIPLRIK